MTKHSRSPLKASCAGGVGTKRPRLAAMSMKSESASIQKACATPGEASDTKAAAKTLYAGAFFGERAVLGERVRDLSRVTQMGRRDCDAMGSIPRRPAIVTRL